MTLAKVNVEFQDFQLGIVPPLGSAHAKIGVASSGPLGSAQTFSRLSQVPTTFPGGPLASALAVALIEAAPVIGWRVPGSVAGVASAVTKAGTGTSVGAVTGSPTDALVARVTITRPGTMGQAGAAYVLTVNGNDVPEQALPVSGAVVLPGLGLTLTFGTGTLVAGDTHTFSATALAATLSDVVTGLTALLATRPSIRFVHILGTATPALFAAVDSVLQERESRNYFTHALLEARPMTAGETMSDYVTSLNALFGNLASDRLALALDGGEVYNPLTQRVETRNSAWILTRRRATRPIGESSYRVRSGAMVGMGDLAFDGNLYGATTRFASLRTIDGREGVYASNWPIMSVIGSDYDEVQAREVADEGARIGNLAFQEYLGDDIPVDTVTGHILETEALALESFVTGRIQAALGDNVSGVRVHVDRTINILSTKRFEADLGIIPLGYMREILLRVGFVNPALALLSAGAAVQPTTTGGSA